MNEQERRRRLAETGVLPSYEDVEAALAPHQSGDYEGSHGPRPERRSLADHLVSLKGPPVAVDGTLRGALHRRPEIEGPASASLDPGSWPQSSARRRLLDLTGGEPLREQFALRQRRTQRSVSDPDGPVGTLSLDSVLVLFRGEPAGRLWCVELELERGKAPHREDHAAGLLADLLAVGGLSVEPLTKLERAMAFLDRART